MTALICGSLAYDTVMTFEGRFREHILPDRIHVLNVSFLAPSMRRNFGGCAGNIAYNLRLLGALRVAKEQLASGAIGRPLFRLFVKCMQSHASRYRHSLNNLATGCVPQLPKAPWDVSFRPKV